MSSKHMLLTYVFILDSLHTGVKKEFLNKPVSARHLQRGVNLKNSLNQEVMFYLREAFRT